MLIVCNPTGLPSQALVIPVCFFNAFMIALDRPGGLRADWMRAARLC